MLEFNTMSTQKIKHERPGSRVDPTAVADFVGIRIPPNDLDVIRAEANAQGLSLSAFIRSAAIGTAVADQDTRDYVLTAAGSAIPNPDLTQLDLTMTE